MRWRKPYKKIGELKSMFNAMDNKQREKIFRYAHRLLSPNRLYGGPFHNELIDDDYFEKFALFICCDYSELQYAVYELDGDGVFIFYKLVLKDDWDREPEPERKPDAFLEFYRDGNRWFFYMAGEREDFAFVENHPCRCELAELSGPWAHGSDDESISNVLSTRFYRDIETVVTVRGKCFRVCGVFSFSSRDVEMLRLSLCDEKGGADE